jgi:hypothetical protein
VLQFELFSPSQFFPIINNQKKINSKMMEGDLKLAQALARISTNNSRSNSPARTGSPNPGADGGGGGTATADDAMKTHASMVLEKIQGFR